MKKKSIRKSQSVRAFFCYYLSILFNRCTEKVVIWWNIRQYSSMSNLIGLNNSIFNNSEYGNCHGLLQLEV